MAKRIMILLIVGFFIYITLPLVTDFVPQEELSYTAKKYVEDGPDELRAQNLVTSVIVTYRGLDTLGEVAVLFIATAGIGFILRKREDEKREKRDASEILKTGASMLLPLIILFGIYIFVNGHLTPGGGFQGGVVIASGILVYLLAFPKSHVSHTIIQLTESVSGAGYVAIGILGLVLAGGFLDNRIMELGQYGYIFSAGAIPVIYSLIGLKVGAELVNILSYLKK